MLTKGLTYIASQIKEETRDTGSTEPDRGRQLPEHEGVLIGGLHWPFAKIIRTMSTSTPNLSNIPGTDSPSSEKGNDPTTWNGPMDPPQSPTVADSCAKAPGSSTAFRWPVA